MFKLAINRPITTLMFFLALMIFGLISAFNMSVNLFPNVSIPLIKITSQSKGDLNFIESKITKEIENALSQIDGVKTITSTSYDNFSVSVVEFKLGKDLEVAANDVRDKIGTLNLASKAQIEKISSDSGSAISLFLYSKDKLKLMHQINDTIKPFLQRIDGVGKIEAKGFLKPQIRIELKPNELKKYNLNAFELANIIQSQNFKQALGELNNKHNNYIIKGYFEATNLKELTNLRIKPGVFLSDVAEISNLYEDEKQSAIYNGKEGVLLELGKVTDYNTLEMIKNVKKALPTLEKQISNDISIDILYDKSLNIHKHLTQVIFDMILGVFLTLIIVFLFLRNFSATLIACVAIPTSIISTFFVIDLLGYDLNRLSFIALTLSIGIFIDDAIVVIENIAKKLKFHPPLEAAFLGINEIGFSVLSITMVLLCVFIPISYMDSIPGLFFNALGISVASGIIISFLVCVFLIPSLSARFLNPKESQFYKKTESFFQNIEKKYEALLHKILQNKIKFIFISFVFILISFALSTRIGLDFLPMEDDSQIQVLLESKKDLSIEAMKEKSLHLLEKIQLDDNVQYAFLLVGYDDAKDATKAKIYIKLKKLEERKLRQSAIVNLYRQKFQDESLKIKILELPKIEGAGIDDPVQFLVLGDDLNTLKKAANRAKEILASNSHIVDINDNANATKDQVALHINQEKAKILDINPDYIAKVLAYSFSELSVGSMDRGNSKDDLILSFAPEFKKNIEALKRINIKNNQGSNLELSSVVDFIYTKDLKNINHYNKNRSIKITAGVNKLSLGTVQKLLLENKDYILGQNTNLNYAFSGFINLLGETVQGFIMAIVLAFILIYLVLAALYESLILPFIIMITMPLAFGGTCIGLFITGHNFSLFVLIAIILLFGMVGKNAILLVDIANKKCHEGLDPSKALLIAGKSRLRAILMTTFAMIFAMIPLAFSKGAGYEANSPMAIAIIFGLISSTLLTLLVVPALFEFCFKLDSKLRKIYEREKLN
ncbi:efflux RND transporter permease subunit [Campylobacter sp. VicNov18]|uniref:efflux RND transporter permease subunit n=1 Tax=Campylobacter bilis TaxID=2691918 RepID=UPI00130DDF36|nr:efflux RND transporter permease subunit [Campylobacter bilis]MPV63714.1 MMPL family transporter [Campylobacter hepaticus]MBM0637215.1 MMPL family transporter [Campylobacter bilis]MCC8277934.1 efflux RND transporter permease subunit [Campylobacter bilis]MCC8298865.1 efflux RND transporter permease subunit [Campylobacter bilis]MCC8300844.1 efflux RND transporter permease subunit [Campylobacter bilis]